MRAVEAAKDRKETDYDNKKVFFGIHIYRFTVRGVLALPDGPV
jgi:hypothetical protein